MTSRPFALLPALALASWLAACTGGSSSNDVSPSAPPVAAPTSSDMFLIFPNPQLPPGATQLAQAQTLSEDYAKAYYAAIDPLNERDTLDKWKAANGFGSGTGTEVTAVFGDVRDLGYGRRMTARRDPARKTIAFLVENYLTSPGGAYGYTPQSLSAAIVKDTRWRIHYNAIEFSPRPGAGPNDAPFAKFFNFDPVTGQRKLTVDIDGRGSKAMPAVCFSCHGGRGDALDRNASGQLFYGSPLFAAWPGASNADGDAQARLQPFEVGNFDFSTMAGNTRADYEAALKLMNRFVMCSYPSAAGSGGNNCPDEPVFKREANVNEWQGGAANLIRNAYGGDGLPNDVYADTYMPVSWANNNPDLYRSVIARSCRACHMLRDDARSANNTDIHLDFDDYATFKNYAPLTRHYMIDLGTMPLAKIVYDNFWQTDGPEKLAQFLEQTLVPTPTEPLPIRDASGKVIQPGRPIADPGPLTRTVRMGWVPLRAVQTFNDAYSWTVVSAPAGIAPAAVPIENANTPQARFNATVPTGTYKVQLVTSRAGVKSDPATVEVFVSNDNTIGLFDQNTIRLAQINTILTRGTCFSCHSSPPSNPVPPVDFKSAPGQYERITSRINFSDTRLSKLLLKPAALVPHAGGSGPLGSFNSLANPGAADRVDYDNFVNWISNDAPQ
ncbi:hypothetical protein [Paraburkholderia fynbosensis]|uniref:Cytochrome c domain-containing protein n=1 Tax=Paraburkholderia fynbosensis TaxID=1200993 RepID=A0A6J5GKW6_9BURK|nr:hypothetical protein [Paraburkholderia fynbosensis]CAB3801439.1 hypothetical protein LMG27177_05057 [Paraburkholderia fynbosensis]